MRIYLIGYMGCGKSSIGRKLSKYHSLQFIDTDSIIEQKEGASCADIINYEGEPYFRRCEQEVLAQTAEVENAVISTGGGLPMWGDNMERISELGVSVYIRRSPEQILSRLSPHGRYKRPKFRGLSDEELLAFMHRNLAEREPTYLRADIVVDCEAMDDATLINTIMQRIKQLKNN
ncbi:MAG: shikimate kinase [Alistipes sp.]|nr:shikimate kinase [Alistipes sp.]